MLNWFFFCSIDLSGGAHLVCLAAKEKRYKPLWSDANGDEPGCIALLADMDPLLHT